MDPIMPPLVAVLLGVLLTGMLLHRLRQPHVVGYLLAGVAIGPAGLGLVSDPSVLSRFGALGVVLLLFFVGMELSPRRLRESWKVALFGTLFQVLVSLGVVALIGDWLAWPTARSVLVAFAISLSSTAVVVKLLADWGEMETRVGQNVVGILLVQDLAVIPMLIVIGLLGAGAAPSLESVILQVFGGLLMLALLIWVIVRETVSLPLGRIVGGDREMQVFAALVICFGLALITALFGLSSALGAFVGGVLVGAARETRWVHESLEPFRVLFVALFFVSVGMLVDLRFLIEHWVHVGLLVAAVLVLNTLINAAVLRILGDPWCDSLYAGALLAQIGEFSFVLALVGVEAGIVSRYGYQTALAVISLSLLLCPFWIRLVKRVLARPGRCAGRET